MQTLRIFISSPGDVAEERDRARQVVESLRRRYAGRFFLKPVLWEELPLQADMSFQKGIDLVLSKDHGVDIAVFILWSRLGSPLGAAIRKPDGTQYRSGTERELDLMLQARKQSKGARPALMVYARRDETSFDERLRGKPTQEKEDIIAQKKLVEQFITEEFHDGGSGHNVRAYHSFDRPVTFSQRLRAHLTELLDELAGGGMTEAVWDIEKQGPPFLGLEAFQPQHADVFFGRETETLEARHALREQARNGCAFLLLSGASGSGKSSLARAGVLPAIVENELDEQVTAWRTIITTPLELGTDPLTGLVRRLAADDVLPDLRGDTESLGDLTEGLRRDPGLTLRLRFKDVYARAAKRQGGGVRVLLVLDQLEELFATAAVSDTARKELLDAVEALSRSGHVWVLATVRSDFWAQVQTQLALVRMTEGRGLLPVLPPETDSLRRLIEEPACLAGLTFEERDGQSLADRILRDAATHAELLPLLEYVLRELFEQRTAERVLTWEAYEKLGGVEGALAKRAEDVFRALPGDAREALGSVLKTIVTIGQEGSEAGSDQIVRQRVPLASLTNKAGAATLVQAFVKERLLTTTKDSASGEAVVTVAHESLLRVWPRAIAWAEHNRDFLRTRARIMARMREGSPLLEGDPLLEAAKMCLDAHPLGWSVDQRIYVTAAVSTAEAKARLQSKRRRVALVALSGLSCAAALGGGVAWHQGRQAERSAADAMKSRDAATAALAASRRSEAEAISSRDTAEGIIKATLYDLRGKIHEKNLLADVSKLANEYFAKRNGYPLPQDPKTAATMLDVRGRELSKNGEHLEAAETFAKSVDVWESLERSVPNDAVVRQALFDALREWCEALTSIAEDTKTASPDDAATLSNAVRRWETVIEHELQSHPKDKAVTNAFWDHVVIAAAAASLIPEGVKAQSEFERLGKRTEVILAKTMPYYLSDYALGRLWGAAQKRAEKDGDYAELRTASERLAALAIDKAKRDPKEPNAPREVCDALQESAQACLKAGDHAAAADAFQRSLDYARAMSPNIDYRSVEIITSLQGLAEVAEAGKNLTQARQHLESALATAEDAVQTVMGGEGENALYWLSNCFGKLAWLAEKEGNLKAERKARERALEIDEKLTGGRLEQLGSLDYDYERLAELAVKDGDLKAALAIYSKERDILQSLVKQSAADEVSRRKLYFCLKKMGNAARVGGDLIRAFKASQANLALVELTLKEHSDDDDWKSRLTDAQRDHGNSLILTKDFDQAHKLFDQVLSQSLRTVKDRPANHPTQGDLARAYLDLSGLLEAETDLSRARTMASNALGVLNRYAALEQKPAFAQRDVVIAMIQGGQSMAQGNLRDAEAHFSKSISVLERMRVDGKLPELFDGGEKALTEMLETVNLRPAGIGMMIEIKDGTLRVSKVLPEAPAGKIGTISPGDELLACAEGTSGSWSSLANVPVAQATRSIRGLADTIVRLKLRRGTEEHEVSLSRQILPANDSALTAKPADVIYADKLKSDQRLWAAERSFLSAQWGVANALSRLSHIANLERNYAEALRLADEALAAVKQTRGNRTIVAGMTVNLAMALIFTKDFDRAERISNDAIADDPKKPTAYTNLAHALMFQGKYDAAHAIHQQHKDDLVDGIKKTWADAIADDFRQFREAGMDHPDMKKIEAFLSIIPADTKK